MRSCYQASRYSDLTQVAVWQAYQGRFYPYVSQGINLLQPGEMIKNVSTAYSNAAAMLLEGPEGRKFIIRGIKPRMTPKDLDGKVWIVCQWQGDTSCDFVGEDWKELLDHLIRVHIDPPRETTVRDDSVADHTDMDVIDTTMIDDVQETAPVVRTTRIDISEGESGATTPAAAEESLTVPIDSQIDTDTPFLHTQVATSSPSNATPFAQEATATTPGTGMEYEPDVNSFTAIDTNRLPPAPPMDTTPRICQWMQCENEFSSLAGLYRHLVTHLANVIERDGESSTRDRIPTNLSVRQRQTLLDDKGQAIGIPITSALVLRNLVRDKDRGAELFQYLEQDALLAAVENTGLSSVVLSEMLAIQAT